MMGRIISLTEIFHTMYTNQSDESTPIVGGEVSNLFDPDVLFVDIVGIVPNGLRVRPLRLRYYSNGYL